MGHVRIRQINFHYQLFEITVYNFLSPSPVEKPTHPGHGSLKFPVMTSIQVGEYTVLVCKRPKHSLKENQTSKVFFCRFQFCGINNDTHYTYPTQRSPT